MTEYRASFDAVITFSNGGGLSAREFRVDTGASFTAVPLRIEGFGTIPVRAYARLPG